MTMIEHVWCSFCEDRPAVGRMVVMQDKSRIQISELTDADGPACDLHGRAWTGVPVAANEGTGGYAVLQYIHPDYEQVTESDIVDFGAEKICCECGDPTEPIPLWAVERILKAYPYLVLQDELRWEGICQRCAHNSSCPHCSDMGNDDDDDDEDGWNGRSIHPYCH